MHSLKILSEKYKLIQEAERGQPLEHGEECSTKHINKNYDDNQLTHCEHWEDSEGYYHRIDGPARTWPSTNKIFPNKKDYYIHGWEYSKAAHQDHYKKWKAMCNIISKANQDSGINTNF